MRAVALALLSAVALAACNPSAPGVGGGENGGAASSEADSGAFPNMANASYRAEATITGEDGRSMPIVMIRSGGKQRMEMSTDEGQSTVITNGETGEAFMITTAGGQTMAMRMNGLNQVSNPADAWSGEIASTAVQGGSCTAAGVTGREWSRVEDGVAKTACVTSDGILLRAAEGDRTVWETTRVERGPQSADLFVLPEGVRVVDLGNMGGVADALQRARSAQQGQ